MLGSLLVDKNLRFDARLALFHEAERWLAIADVHYGFELSQRAGGALFPAWGMREIEDRLFALLQDYQPQTLLFLGDLIHTAAAARPFLCWVEAIRPRVENLVLLRGNHDRGIQDLGLELDWRIGPHLFHHGDRPVQSNGHEIVFSGHLHPAETISDGAGLYKKFPALYRTPAGWILPAFSPWAAGGVLEVETTGRWCVAGAGIRQLRNVFEKSLLT